MKKIGIVQPGRLGDLIILLPAVKYLHDSGYEIVWPIFNEYVDMFTEVIDYATFIPVDSNVYTCINNTYTLLKQNNVSHIKDVAATFPGSVCTDEYVRCGDGLGEEKFDQFKYRLLDVPFEEKWNLTINRNYKKETEIFNKYVKSIPYVVSSLNHSKGRINVTLDPCGRDIVEINTKHSLFYWIQILEKAEMIALVDSSMFNLVEQLNLPNKKILFQKPDNRLPTIRNKWRII
jgi:hypothetical protein